MSEAKFLSGYDPDAYDRPALAVDLVLLGLHDGRPSVLLLQRAEHPHAGRWALPGGFVALDETLDAAAERVLRDKAGLAGIQCEQLYTFGALDRDPRMRIVSVAYLALLPERAFGEALDGMPKLSRAVIDVPWTGEAGGPVAVLPADGRMRGEPLALAFDHAEILALAILRLRGKLDYSDVGFALLPEHFTLRQLQDVHEAILGTPLNKPAFRRRMLDRGWLAPTGSREAGTSFRPAELYRFQKPS
ncbi:MULTISPECIES: NUDIX hydrolase [Methylobacterium]|uniref:GDP-mannose mannosyl hydrolase n=1 Tax=Methylobacterium thuringiense TaxID=1003091 RepID=A0ABQ4THS4_9HYPH|nr:MULTISPECIES: NUDIX domain-containing protein [Methylobacterium]TXN22192.1 NUDIX domain-containing protein [Methylobacterium sp. WL9]GJE53602.1 GDP-mannose mannosyl hydrolase [Methylobacterium thuringiense]